MKRTEFQRILVANRAEIAVATGMARRGEVDLARLELGPNEGLVLRLPG